MPTACCDPAAVPRESPRLRQAVDRQITNAERTRLRRARPRSRLYIVVEKILGHNETLPTKTGRSHGTTGYGFLNLLNGLFVDRRGWPRFAKLPAIHRSDRHLSPRCCSRASGRFSATSLSSELYMLSHQLTRIAEQHRWSRDFTRLSLYRALRDVVACFQVYRTYIRPGVDEVRPTRIGTGSSRRSGRRRRRNPAMSPSFFDFIAVGVAARRSAGPVGRSIAHERRDFVLKFQQVTEPGGGQGLGRHGVLSLLSAGVAERSGRRSGDRPALRRSNSTAAFIEHMARLAARHVGHRHARHEARRGLSRPPECA